MVIREIMSDLTFMIAEKNREYLSQRIRRDHADVYEIQNVEVLNMYDDFAKVLTIHYRLVEMNCNPDFDW